MVVFPQKITIELIISILAFLLSSILTIHQLYFERRQLKIRIVKAYRNSDNVHFLMVFENRSRLPISITNITLCVGDGIECEHLPKLIGTERYRPFSDCPPILAEIYSLEVPIVLQGLGSLGGYILFDDPAPALPVDAKSATFLIQASRGNAKRIELDFQKGFGYHIRDTVHGNKDF